MDSIEFYNFSNNLRQKAELTEIDCRQIVSRSYYCSFHKVKEACIDKLNVPINSYKGSVHITLSDVLKALNPPNPILRKIGFKLNNFHSRRVNADYKLEIVISEKHADESLLECQKILDLLRQAQPQP